MQGLMRLTLTRRDDSELEETDRESEENETDPEVNAVYPEGYRPIYLPNEYTERIGRANYLNGKRWKELAVSGEEIDFRRWKTCEPGYTYSSTSEQGVLQ